MKLINHLLILMLLVSWKGYSQDKEAFGKTVGSIYTPGTVVFKISGGYLSTRTNILAGGEYYFSEKFRASITAGYINDEHFGASRTLWPIYLESGFKFYQIQNVLFINGILGIGNSFQTLSDFEAPGDLKNSVISGIIGGEIMLNVIPKISFFVDVRQVLGITDDNHQLVYSVGLKKSFRF